ncbi:MAG: type I restriction-modification system subunit M N-terminal domain-containing protein [Oceanispirochaeta sp.]|jgi:hypothetical protein|nr:type I restriction-modification system subunit M N-terminal domain-containing protein [Oceanispirochaeta sp.]MDA3957348.1 type I restriction-modification system subunit M N-terminal domain-containing protein [Oceanispirochaeta sp.]
MARQTDNNNNNFEKSLWDTANKLRGSVESSEYKHVVLSLIFLKFISDKFEERKIVLVAEGKEKYIDMVEFYTMKNVFYLPEESRWSFIKQHAKQDDIASRKGLWLIELIKSFLMMILRRLPRPTIHGAAVPLPLGEAEVRVSYMKIFPGSASPPIWRRLSLIIMC